MEAGDVADQIVELKEGESGGERDDDEKFRSRVALMIAFMAMLLAITSLGGGNAAEDIMNHNIHASDTWAFYQAKNIRQTSYRIAADALEGELLLHGATLSPEAREAVERKIEQFKATAARYESEPDPQAPNDPLKGEGKKELSARAKDFSAQRDRAQLQDPNFDFSEALFQIAIVLASVSILATSRLIMKVSVAVGIVATILMLNGYFLFLNLPF
ncbi:MAG TPA: DUF4337 domain-containing protein [Pyrinomonadaceae bacterium]|nr:DUF4337 domain-containing protein [Pyrinomonadaceae bacterium]